MDLRTYEQIKFELAELVRSGQFIASRGEDNANKRWQIEEPWRELLTRLADDRFTVVVAGRFNRGKSSLMNAILGMDRLPTGVVPLTSVITSVRYGTSERVLIDYQGSGLRGEARLEDLPRLVTEKGNPGNVKRIRAAEIQLPAEILRRGFFFVDTPGLGSAIFENSQTTERFLPEIDVLVLVTSYESPLTEDEIRFLRRAALSVRAIFVVVNKQDTAAPTAREEILEYVAKTVGEILDARIAKPFSVSARDGLEAKQSNDRQALKASGILDLEEELVRFLTTGRSRLFLSAMFERVSGVLGSLPPDEAEPLVFELQALRDRIHPSNNEERTGAGSIMVAESSKALISSRGFTPCEVCQAVVHQLLEFFRQYQYDLAVRPQVQEEHANQGGFCPLHTWHYEQVASPRGICTGYPRLLNRVAQTLRTMAADGSGKAESGGGFLDHPCPACRVRRDTENRTVHSLALKLEKERDARQLSTSALCLPHLELLLRHIGDPVRQRLLLREASLMERTAEDMQRYAIKHDALRRHLTSKEENDAPLLGLQLLTGHRNVGALFTVQDIL